MLGVWTIIAFSKLGFGDKAVEYYRMITPVEHSRTKEAAKKYKVEPYVIAADIYGSNNLAGRGGWTWYTGSSSWYYKAGIECIIGMKIENNILKIEPCIPKEWKEYSIRYRYKTSIYNIKVKNPMSKVSGVDKLVLNGVEQLDKDGLVKNEIKLLDDGSTNEIEVTM
jgi:cyclic beta-1,2-glucan synthetase